jgi:hypothetical protein
MSGRPWRRGSMIRDRIDAYERGDVTAVPAEQALAQIVAVAHCKRKPGYWRQR